MDLLGVICSDSKINGIIKGAFVKDNRSKYDLRFLSKETQILEFLNYDIPEVVIINFSDPDINLEYIVKQVKGDVWLHNFGIIGLFDQEKDNEERLLKKLKEINVLAMLNYYRIRSHIKKSVEIIQQNYQIIFQRELADKLFEKSTGSFTIDNDILGIPIYAGIAATILSQRGYIDPDSKMYLQLSLAELIVNGVEHGNCGVTFEEKTDFLDRGLSVVELVAEKCKNPAIAKKKIILDWEINKENTRFVIRDQGKGFEVGSLNEKLKRAGELSLHGRGIQMAKMLAQELYYNEKGNEVTIVIKHDESIARETPIGFSGEEELCTKKGDIIFQEGESSNFLYYISSGTFSIFHNKKVVGMLSPTDIFMGEMSFLLNNKRSAAVRAESQGKLIKISRKTFVSVIKKYPHYGIFLSKLLAKRLVRANERNVQKVNRKNI